MKKTKKESYKERQKRVRIERKEREVVEAFLERKFTENKKKQAEDLSDAENRRWKASAESEFDRIWAGKPRWRS
jgi:hypothetical protein